VLRLSPEGKARVTIPPRGSVHEGRDFAQRHAGWLENQLRRREANQAMEKQWRIGRPILFRGERVALQVEVHEGRQSLRFGEVRLAVKVWTDDWRQFIEAHLRRLAAAELAARTLELAGVHEFIVNRVTVRNQRSRWGSCSRRGTISLNWRLIQAPGFVSDYLILHELAHLKEMNHSRRFWREVERLCPGFAEAEKWLKGHGF